MVEFIKHFFATCFKTAFEFLRIKLAQLNPIRYTIGREKCPTTGEEHFHIFCEMEKKRRFSAVGKLLGCHIEPIKKHPLSKEYMYFESQQYCKKDGDWIQFGPPVEEVLRETKPCPFVECISLARDGKLDEIRDNYPKMFVIHLTKWKIISAEVQSKEMFPNRKCLWIHGLSGIGKSRWVSTNFPDAYRKNAEEVHFERYRNERIVVIEDMMPHHRKEWLYPLLMCSDIYAFMPKVRYGSVCLRHDILIVTSNYALHEIFPFDESRGGPSPWQRRFIEIHAMAWAEEENDLLIKIGTSIFYQCLIGYLLTHYYISF